MMMKKNSAEKLLSYSFVIVAIKSITITAPMVVFTLLMLKIVFYFTNINETHIRSCDENDLQARADVPLAVVCYYLSV